MDDGQLFRGRIEEEFPATITSYGLRGEQPLRSMCIEALYPIVQPNDKDFDIS